MPEVVRIPVHPSAASEGDIRMVAGVFRPQADEPVPVVIYSHGRSGTEQDRHLTRLPDPRGHVRYWLRKGYAVVAPIRPGYGDTAGFDGEDSGVRYDIFGNCWGTPDFARAASTASTSVLATLRWLRTQPWADARRVVLVGTSMGGLTSLASAAANPPGVIGYINFAGGTGGSGRAPGNGCGSPEMTTLMSAYGKAAHVPGLWLYAENDHYWGAEWPRTWYRAFAAGAGAESEFVMTDAVANADGHQLLARGGRLWARYVDRFLDSLETHAPSSMSP